MTLLITRLTPFGIAMAADTAVTSPSTGPDGKKTLTVEPSAAVKLFRVSGLQAGVSCWGRGNINGTDTSSWLNNFISDGGTFPSLKVFAHRLGVELNRALKGQLTGQNSIGFHIAGYEVEPTGPEPNFFHVHDGRSDIFTDAEPRQINVHHDCKPEGLKALFRQGRYQEMRNGEFSSYAVVTEALGKAFEHLQSVGWPRITVQQLSDVAKYNVAEICLMSDIYAIFGMPVIGGEVHYLSIPESGDIEVKVHPNTSGATSRFEFPEPEVSPQQGKVSSPQRGIGAGSGHAPKAAPSHIPQTNHIAISGWSPPRHS